MQAVERLGDHAHSTVEPDAVIGDAEVVVHRLGDTDHARLMFGESRSDAERVITTDGDESVELEALEIAQNLVHATLDLHRIHARAAEHRAAQLQDPREPVTLQGEDVALANHPRPPVADADHSVARRNRTPADRADRGVETWRITAARQDGNPLSHSSPTFVRS